MGYGVNNSKSSFSITNDNLPHALAALCASPFWKGAQVEDPSHVFRHFGLDISRDEAGNVTDLGLAAESLGSLEEEAFHAVAPFVADGSYVMFIGEDGAQWAWVFARNPTTGAVEAQEEDVIPVLVSEHRRLTAAVVPS